MPTPWKRTAIIGLAGVAAMAASAGNAAAITPTDQSLEAPGSVEKGATVTLSGTLTGLRDRPLGDQPVALERTAGDGWSTVATATTDDTGGVTFRRTPERTAEWRIRYSGDTFHDPTTSGTQRIAVRTPPPPSPPAPAQQSTSIANRIVHVAAGQAGAPYAYGASGPARFDCSGFAQYVHRRVGIELPRTSGEQHRAVRSIPRHAKVPGDLVFFHDGGSVYHVGVYAGNNRVWAAPETGDVVRKQSIYTGSYYVGRAW